MAEGTSGTAGGGGGGHLSATVTEYVSSIIQSNLVTINRMYMDSLMESVNVFRGAIDKQNTVFMQTMERATVVLENSLQTITDGFTKTANEIGSSALRARMNEAKTNIKTRIEERKADIAFEKLKFQSQKKIAEIYIDAAKDIGVSKFNLVGGTAQSLFKTLSEMAGLFEGVVSGVMDFTFMLTNTSYGVGSYLGKLNAEQAAEFAKNYMEFQLQNIELQEKVYDIAEQRIQAVLDQSGKIVDKFIEMNDNTNKAVSNADTASHKFGVTMGFYGKQGNEYAKSMMLTAKNIGDIFGKTAEELVVAQQAYVSASGRNVNMTAADYNNLFSVGRAFGLGDNEVANLFGSMNVFNTSVESGTDMMNGMYKTVTKMGLSASKFAKDLTNNLRLAQKYNFKGGVENMMKMTQWAEQTRFNLNAATSFSDKILGGDISNAVETSAKLQVLGGSAAIYSDPLAMLYEAGADVGQLARRQAAMFNDIAGTFNEKTGETDFSWYENYMIKQRAQAAGISEEDAKNMIRQRHKQKVIDMELRGFGLDEATRTAIGNRATYNQASGRWEVTDIQNNKHDIAEVARDTKLLEKLMPEDNGDAMLKIAQESLGFAEKQTNFQAYIAQALGADNYDKVKSASEQMLAMEKGYYRESWGEINNRLDLVRNSSVEALEYQYGLELANSKEITGMLKDYLVVMRKLTENAQNRLDENRKQLETWASLNGGGEAIFEHVQNQVLGNASEEALSANQIYAGSMNMGNEAASQVPKIRQKAEEYSFRNGLIKNLHDTSTSMALDMQTLELSVKQASDSINKSMTDITKYYKLTYKYGFELMDKTIDDLKINIIEMAEERYPRLGHALRRQYENNKRIQEQIDRFSDWVTGNDNKPKDNENVIDSSTLPPEFDGAAEPYREGNNQNGSTISANDAAREQTEAAHAIYPNTSAGRTEAPPIPTAGQNMAHNMAGSVQPNVSVTLSANVTSSRVSGEDIVNDMLAEFTSNPMALKQFGRMIDQGMDQSYMQNGRNVSVSYDII